MKTNFKKDESSDSSSVTNSEESKKDLTQEEFEEYISKSGAKGSFMIYRSEKNSKVSTGTGIKNYTFPEIFIEKANFYS